VTIGCFRLVSTGVAVTHEGNRRFRELVDSHAAQYKQMVDRLSKERLVATLIREWKEGRGGRFLRRGVDGQWYEVGDDNDDDAAAAAAVAAMAPVVQRRLQRLTSNNAVVPAGEADQELDGFDGSDTFFVAGLAAEILDDLDAWWLAESLLE
jgi:hypothetical protein